MPGALAATAGPAGAPACAHAGAAQAAPSPAVNHAANDAASGVRRARAAQGRVRGSKSENRDCFEAGRALRGHAAGTVVCRIESIIHEGFDAFDPADRSLAHFIPFD